MGRAFVPLLIVICSASAAVWAAEEKTASKTSQTSPRLGGAIRRSMVYDPKARERALAKAAEERPTDVIFLQDFVVLAPPDNRSIGRAIAWQEEVTVASRFSFENGGALLKVPFGEMGVSKYKNLMAKDASFSTKPESPRFVLFQLHP